MAVSGDEEDSQVSVRPRKSMFALFSKCSSCSRLGTILRTFKWPQSKPLFLHFRSHIVLAWFNVWKSFEDQYLFITGFLCEACSHQWHVGSVYHLLVLGAWAQSQWVLGSCCQAGCVLEDYQLLDFGPYARPRWWPWKPHTGADVDAHQLLDLGWWAWLHCGRCVAAFFDLLPSWKLFQSQKGQTD